MDKEAVIMLQTSVVLDDGRVKRLGVAGFRLYMALVAQTFRTGAISLPPEYGRKEMLRDSGLSDKSLRKWLPILFEQKLVTPTEDCGTFVDLTG